MDLSASSIDSPSASALDNWKNHQPSIRNERIKSIVKVTLAVSCGLAITAGAFYFSGRLIYSPDITTGFYGMFSLILTVPIGVAAPLVLGIKVYKKQDWTRYDDEKTAELKMGQFYNAQPHEIKTIPLERYEKVGLLTKEIRKKAEEFKARYETLEKQKMISQDIDKIGTELSKLRWELRSWLNEIMINKDIPFTGRLTSINF